jgi:hypothetical protein
VAGSPGEDPAACSPAGPRAADRQPRPDHQAEPARNQRPARRNGALAALAADLPAAILADLLGMHVHTAVRWVTYARRDWAEYLAAWAADIGEPIQDE